MVTHYDPKWVRRATALVLSSMFTGAENRVNWPAVQGSAHIAAKLANTLFSRWPGKGVQYHMDVTCKASTSDEAWSKAEIRKVLHREKCSASLLHIYWSTLLCKSELLHRYKRVPLLSKVKFELLHCTARLPLLKYPFLAIFLLPHIWGEGHVDERRDFKKDCFEQNFLCFAFISPSHFFQLSKITSGLAENNDTRPKWQKKR